LLKNNREETMKRYIAMLIAAVMLLAAVGCATVRGTVVGAGIGALAGDAKLGAQIGMTVGAAHDIFGR
jgi:hypothetical protein